MKGKCACGSPISTRVSRRGGKVVIEYLAKKHYDEMASDLLDSYELLKAWMEGLPKAVQQKLSYHGVEVVKQAYRGNRFFTTVLLDGQECHAYASRGKVFFVVA